MTAFGKSAPAAGQIAPAILTWGHHTCLLHVLGEIASYDTAAAFVTARFLMDILMRLGFYIIRGTLYDTRNLYIDAHCDVYIRIDRSNVFCLAVLHIFK